MTPPEGGKWTNFGPSLDWCFANDAPHGFFEHYVGLAFGCLSAALQKQGERNDSKEGGSVRPDPKELEPVNWHKVAGERMKKTVDLGKDDVVKKKYRMFVVVLEVFRQITCWWLRCSRNVHRPCEELAPCSFVSPERSPHMTAMQYLSLLSAGQGSRLRFIWQLAGYQSYKEWLRQEPESAELLRVLIICTSAWIYRRHQMKADGYPWPLARIADTTIN